MKLRTIKYYIRTTTIFRKRFLFFKIPVAKYSVESSDGYISTEDTLAEARKTIIRICNNSYCKSRYSYEYQYEQLELTGAIVTENPLPIPLFTWRISASAQKDGVIYRLEEIDTNTKERKNVVLEHHRRKDVQDYMLTLANEKCKKVDDEGILITDESTEIIMIGCDGYSLCAASVYDFGNTVAGIHIIKK